MPVHTVSERKKAKKIAAPAKKKAKAAKSKRRSR